MSLYLTHLTDIQTMLLTIHVKYYDKAEVICHKFHHELYMNHNILKYDCSGFITLQLKSVQFFNL